MAARVAIMLDFISAWSVAVVSRLVFGMIVVTPHINDFGRVIYIFTSQNPYQGSSMINRSMVCTSTPRRMVPILAAFLVGPCSKL